MNLQPQSFSCHCTEHKLAISCTGLAALDVLPNSYAASTKLSALVAKSVRVYCLRPHHLNDEANSWPCAMPRAVRRRWSRAHSFPLEHLSAVVHASPQEEPHARYSIQHQPLTAHACQLFIMPSTESTQHHHQLLPCGHRHSEHLPSCHATSSASTRSPSRETDPAAAMSHPRCPCSAPWLPSALSRKPSVCCFLLPQRRDAVGAA